MKKIYYLFLAVLISAFAQSQNPIPNPGFETWTNPSYPDGCQYSVAITKTTANHSGQFAAKGEKLTGAGDPDLAVGDANGFPVSVNYAYLNLYYIFSKAGSDTLTISVYMDDNLANTLGMGSKFISTASPTYKALSVPISYTGSGVTSGYIEIFIDNATVSSLFIIDDISLSSSPLAVDEIEKETSDLQLFPNPATGYVQFYFTGLQNKTAGIQITDLTGRIVKEMSLVSFAGNYLTVDISGLPSGNYIVAIKNDEILRTKMLVVK